MTVIRVKCLVYMSVDVDSGRLSFCFFQTLRITFKHNFRHKCALHVNNDECIANASIRVQR